MNNKSTTRSRSSLFLLELILCIIILSIACMVCVQVFTSAYQGRISAREMNHLQVLITDTGEIMKATDGTPGEFARYFAPASKETEDTLVYMLDACMKPTEDSPQYMLTLVFSVNDTAKSCSLSCARMDGSSKYSQDYSFPR